jgi:hypothetical protein
MNHRLLADCPVVLLGPKETMQEDDGSRLLIFTRVGRRMEVKG